MSKTIEKTAVFQELRETMSSYSDHLDLVTDDEISYFLNTHHIMKNKKPLFFGAVQIKKNYVSYHLMPVYVDSSLLDNISEPLKKRMQGKSCFNFKSVEKDLFSELASLTEAAYQSYVQAGYVKTDS
jgi:hypothetical protein